MSLEGFLDMDTQWTNC